MTDIKEKLTDAATSLSEGASGVANDLQSHAKDAWTSVQRGTRRAVREGAAYARKHLGPTALVACGVGLALGLFLKRNTAASEDGRIAKPLHQSRGLLFGLLVALGTMFRRTFTSASGAAREIAGDAGEDLKDALKPLKKAAQEAERKLGL